MKTKGLQAAEHLIFDFDGTIVDSAPAILECFRNILAARGIAPQATLDSRLIGPPLTKTLALLVGNDNPEVLQQLVAEFKQEYDQTGVIATQPYPGILDALQQLRNFGYRLHIATNKRIVPTRLILKQLGVDDYFETIYAVDSQTPAYPSKSAMIAHQLAAQHIASDTACYIGDKFEDGEAADANRLTFLIAGWGYGEWQPGSFPACWQLFDAAPQLAAELLATE